MELFDPNDEVNRYLEVSMATYIKKKAYVANEKQHSPMSRSLQLTVVCHAASKN